jgi:hypothetical protein
MGNIPKTVMNDVSRVPIDDFENTLEGTVSQTVRSGNGPYTGPCPYSPPYGFLHHTIGTLNNAIRIPVITVLGMLTCLWHKFSSDYLGGIIKHFARENNLVRVNQ